MARKSRILKSNVRNIKDLDDNLFLVRRQLDGLRNDPAYFKVLVAALRTLICTSSGTEGLLWRVAENLDVSDRMRIHGFGGFNLDSPQARGLRLAVGPVFRLGEGPPGMPEADVSLREFVKDSEGIFFAGKGITWEQMIKIWAQQMGLSHESEDVDPALVALHQFPISILALQQALVTITEFAIEIGERVLACAETDHRYVRAVRSGHGDMSIFAVLEPLQQPVGEFPIFSMRCPLVEATITCSVLPTQVKYVVQRGNHTIGEFGLPFPNSGRAAIYVLQYSSNMRQTGMSMTDLIGEDSETKPSRCNIGWIEALEVRSPEVFEFPTDIVFNHGIGLHKNWLGPSDFRDLFQFPGIFPA